jgi:carbon monoxide dehydrogenase subunit G
MKSIFSSICKISRPVSEVFEVLCRPEKFPHFIPAIKEARWEDSSPLGTGKVYLETREALGRRVTAKVHISQFEIPTKIAYKSTAAGVTAEYVYTLAEYNGGTNITLEAFSEASGLAKLFQPVFTSAMKKSDSNQLAAMKYFLERT